MNAPARTASFLVIDPWVPTISKIDFDPLAETLPILYQAIECDTVTVEALGQTLDGLALDMWLDDEGLFKDEQRYFAILGEDKQIINTFAGRAVIAASDREGATVGLGLPLEEFERLVRRVAFFAPDDYALVDEQMKAQLDTQPQIITLP